MLEVPFELWSSQVTTNRPWLSIATRGGSESAVAEPLTLIGPPAGWPRLSNRGAEMSWSRPREGVDPDGHRRAVGRAGVIRVGVVGGLGVEADVLPRAEERTGGRGPRGPRRRAGGGAADFLAAGGDFQISEESTDHRRNLRWLW